MNRLFEMIYFLLDKKRVTAQALAQHFEVSTRTIYRDIELLSAAGVPVYMTKGKGGGISLLPNFVLDKTVLTKQEKTEILSALQAVKAVNANEPNTAIRKLSSLFGGNSSDWIEVDFEPWGEVNQEAVTFQSLKEAILNKQQVYFAYHNVRGEHTKRKVEPLKLCFKGQGWYLYAFCLQKQDYRFFKLRRIKKLQMLEGKFERFAPAKVLAEQDKTFYHVIKVVLKLNREVAFRVYDEFDDYEELDDGSFIATLTVPQQDWLYYYIATFGEHCYVIEPSDIRIKVKQQLQKTLQYYL